MKTVQQAVRQAATPDRRTSWPRATGPPSSLHRRLAPRRTHERPSSACGPNRRDGRRGISFSSCLLVMPPFKATTRSAPSVGRPTRPRARAPRRRRRCSRRGGGRGPDRDRRRTGCRSIPIASGWYRSRASHLGRPPANVSPARAAQTSGRGPAPASGENARVDRHDLRGWGDVADLADNVRRYAPPHGRAIDGAMPIDRTSISACPWSELGGFAGRRKGRPPVRAPRASRIAVAARIVATSCWWPCHPPCVAEPPERHAWDGTRVPAAHPPRTHACRRVRLELPRSTSTRVIRFAAPRPDGCEAVGSSHSCATSRTPSNDPAGPRVGPCQAEGVRPGPRPPGPADRLPTSARRSR